MPRFFAPLLALCLWLSLLGPAAAHPPAEVAVLPFANASGDARLDWLGKAVAQTLAYKLSHLGAFRMADPALVQRASGGNPPADQDAALQMARASGASVAVMGTITRTGNRIAVRAQFVDENGVFGEEERQGDLTPTDLFDMQDQIGFKLIKLLKMPALGPSERIAFQFVPSRSLPAYEAATRATAALYDFLADRGRREQLAAAVAGLQKATRLDPYYAEAFGQLALAQLLQRQYEQAYRSAQKAVSLYSGLPEGFAVLGRASLELKKTAQAQAAASRALRTPCSSLCFALAQTTLGLVYQSQGKLQDAVDRYRIAIGRLPILPEPYHRLAAYYKGIRQPGPAADIYELYLKALPGADDAEQVRAEVAKLREDVTPPSVTPTRPSSRPPSRPPTPQPLSEPPPEEPTPQPSEEPEQEPVVL